VGSSYTYRFNHGLEAVSGRDLTVVWACTFIAILFFRSVAGVCLHCRGTRGFGLIVWGRGDGRTIVVAGRGRRAEEEEAEDELCLSPTRTVLKFAMFDVFFGEVWEINAE
jgi:hypothetical protein